MPWKELVTTNSAFFIILINSQGPTSSLRSIPENIARGGGTILKTGNPNFLLIILAALITLLLPFQENNKIYFLLICSGTQIFSYASLSKSKVGSIHKLTSNPFFLRYSTPLISLTDNLSNSLSHGINLS